MHLASIHLHPIKSAAAISVPKARVEPRGLQHDRRWMVVDAQGKFITGRTLPRLTLVVATPEAGNLVLEAPGMPRLRVPMQASDTCVQVQVWKSEVIALAVDAAADAWLSTFLGHPVQLVHMDSSVSRLITSSHGGAGDEVSFADAFPLLLISLASLQGLNDRLAKPVTMQRFRPNLVVDGVAAHAEDAWKRIRVGDIEFEVAKACVRCVFTTVDPAQGTRDADGEPLRTLIKYRRSDDGVTFGQLLIPRSTGVLHRGDPVTVLG